MYRNSLPSSQKPYGTHRNHAQGLRPQPIRVGIIKQLHKAAMGGVAAVDFIPGYKSRTVSIGHDGKCRLVEFEGGAQILRTWHVSGPATCLSISAKVRRLPKNDEAMETYTGNIPGESEGTS